MFFAGETCDKCGVVIRVGGTSKGAMIALVRAHGWSVGKPKEKYKPEVTLCPACRRGGKAKKEAAQ